MQDVCGVMHMIFYKVIRLHAQEGHANQHSIYTIWVVIVLIVQKVNLVLNPYNLNVRFRSVILDSLLCLT